MSLNRAFSQPSPAAPTTRPERRLRPVTAPAPRRRPKLAYALIALGGAMAIGAAQVALSLVITQDSFVLADLTSQQNELNLQTSALKDDLAGISSPQMLATKASALGLVVTGSASYLRLSDSVITGTNTGASFDSTVDPTGSGAVHNALLVPETAPVVPAAEGVTDGDAAVTVDPNIPPPITDGLPSPTTH